MRGDEKRQLILAHAAMRDAHDPIQAMTVWAGVAVAAFVVALGWWWTVGSTVFDPLKNLSSSAHGSVASVVQAAQAQDVTVQSNDVADTLNAAQSKLEALQTQTDAQQTALDRMAAIVSATDTTRGDIFTPGSPSTSSKTTTP